MRSVVPPAAICTRQLTELKVLKAHTISDLMEPDSPEKFAREHSNLRVIAPVHRWSNKWTRTIFDSSEIATCSHENKATAQWTGRPVGLHIRLQRWWTEELLGSFSLVDLVLGNRTRSNSVELIDAVQAASSNSHRLPVIKLWFSPPTCRHILCYTESVQTLCVPN